jgi:hypothetical protein
MRGRVAIVVASAALLLAAPPADAQIRGVAGPARGWISGFVGRYTDVGNVVDPASGSTWVFAESWAVGAGYSRVLTPGLAIGLDMAWAAPQYERRIDNTAVAAGRATILTPQLSGRFQYGGGVGLAFYLTGAGGTMIYRIPDLGRSDLDLAFYVGTGLEYQTGGRRAFFLEWGRFWAYHEGEGLESNRVNHSLIRLGARFGH